MNIYFWNDKSDNVTTGESYSISGLVMRSFEGALVLNTTADTTCKPIPPIKNVHDIKALFDEKTHMYIYNRFMSVIFAAAKHVTKNRSKYRTRYCKMLSLYDQTENNRVEENTCCISYYSR